MNPILHYLTRSQIRRLGGKYITTKTIKLPTGEEQEILVYTGDKCLFLGQCTLFRTIIIKDSILNNSDLFNYVFTHEMAHKNQWRGIFFYPLALLILASVSALGASLFLLIQLISSLNFIYLASFILGLVIAIVLFIIPCAFSWLMELNADFKAINLIGLQRYLNIVNVLPKIKPTLSQKIIIRMTHPPFRVTAYLWNRYHKKKGQGKSKANWPILKIPHMYFL